MNRTNKNHSKIIFLVLALLIFLICFGFENLIAAQIQLDSTAITGQDSGISYASQKDEMNNYFFRVIWVTLFILGLIIAGFFIYRKSMGKFIASGKNKIKVTARYSLGPKQMLLVVHVEKQKLLIGVTEHGINLLKDFGPAPDDEEEVELPQSLSSSFGSILDKLKKNQ